MSHFENIVKDFYSFINNSRYLSIAKTTIYIYIYIYMKKGR
jgi:hypothetical protein